MEETLNKIPETQVDNFPDRVSEVVYQTYAEMNAFLRGLNYTDDVDIITSDVFERDGSFVVRVKIGNWDQLIISHNGN